MAVYPHLKIVREQHVNEKRPGGPPRFIPPSDIPGHARKLQGRLSSAKQNFKNTIGGFDPRLLIKLKIGKFSPEKLALGFPGVEILSQEDGGFVLAFASEDSLREFDARLTSLVTGGNPTYKDVLYALEDFDCWQPEDRMGWALKRDGLPKNEQFLLDIELWPLQQNRDREAMKLTFENWLRDHGCVSIDSINKEDYIAYRVRLSKQQAELVLNHRDVRTVDLPPKFGLELRLLRLDIQNIPPVQPPPDSAPGIAVLDSGIAGGHPLLGAALGEAQGYVLPNKEAHDDNGHGTHVAGIALYGDVEECAQSMKFTPELRLFSGRILNDKAESDPRFIENIVTEAVNYFYQNHQCRVFNLSYGDTNKPYAGGRVRGLAYTLDCLSRELDVLFVVPTGNRDSESNHYPDYLLDGEGWIVDPAPAFNVLTVGSIARYDQTKSTAKYPSTIEEIAIAQKDQPSPFTRCGPLPKGIVKPELVAYGGNEAFNPRVTGPQPLLEMGELSTNKDFAVAGRLLGERIGTSFAAPHVAHAAAKILLEEPQASANLLRALLVAAAKIPIANTDLFTGDKNKLAQALGYGLVDSSYLYKSTEEHVFIIAEEKLTNKCNQFYEVPMPPSFYSPGKRLREITVALAYSPPVRTTRLDYKSSRIQFRLLDVANIQEAFDACNKAMAEEMETISEFMPSNRSNYSSTKREVGTVQASTWKIKSKNPEKLILVVTRNDFPWGEQLTNQEEPYAVVIRMSDRENQEARLYSEIHAILQQKLQLSGRVQV